jgi:A/G-specific adenine glycosylase
MPVDGDAAAYCIRHFGLEVSPLGHMGQGAPLDHVFTHFKLRIHPQPLRVVSAPPAAMRDEARWMTLDDALAAAIPAPARTLLLRLGPPGRAQAEQSHG